MFMEGSFCRVRAGPSEQGFAEKAGGASSEGEVMEKRKEIHPATDGGESTPGEEASGFVPAFPGFGRKTGSSRGSATSFFPSAVKLPTARLARLVEKASTNWGVARLRKLVEARGRVSETMGDIPHNMHLVASQTRLVLELIDDFRDGTYREIPWRKMALLVGAVLYAINPADVIPNFLPLVGTMDDIAVVALVTRVLRKDLMAYCEFKGYPVEDYFRV